MAFFDTTWYVNDGDNSTTGWWAVTAWTTLTTWVAGQLIRQSGTPTVGNERVYVCLVGGLGGVNDPLTTFTRGVKITDGLATWQECTGAAAVNGDVTNTPNWTTVKSAAVTLGQIIKRDNAASYWICSTAGTAGASEPAWPDDNAGSTRTDGVGTLVWTCIGAVGNFTGWQAPHARLKNVWTATWAAAGSTTFVASEHAETQAASMTNAALSYCYLYCVDKNNVPPTSANLTTGASISTTTNKNLSNTRSFFCFGVK